MKASIASALAAAVVWYLVFLPMRSEIETRRAHVAKVESEIQRARASAVAARAAEQENRKHESALEALRPGGTTTLDRSAVIGFLQVAAAAARVRITALKPHNEPMRAGEWEQPVELGVEGTFHDVGRFLGRVASSPRVMTASDISIRTRPGDTGGGNVIGSIVIVAFDFAPGGAAPDAALAYDDGGRRDPFASQVVPEPAPPAVAAGGRGRGLAATPLSEVVVRGVTRDGTRRLAILETANRQSFVVRASDRLADSIVHDIDPTGVMFVQPDRRGEPVRVHRPLQRSQMERP